MAVTHKLYGPAMKNILDGTVDLKAPPAKIKVSVPGKKKPPRKG